MKGVKIHILEVKKSLYILYKIKICSECYNQGASNIHAGYTLKVNFLRLMQTRRNELLRIEIGKIIFYEINTQHVPSKCVCVCVFVCVFSGQTINVKF